MISLVTKLRDAISGVSEIGRTLKFKILGHIKHNGHGETACFDSYYSRVLVMQRRRLEQSQVICWRADPGQPQFGER